MTSTPKSYVAGIGDMSGDVFGNGMLLSRNIELVAAFDHRHIFLDPDPDAEALSFDERARLFRCPPRRGRLRPTKISAGGGVWPRSAKSIPLSQQARRRLGVDADECTPDELVQAILRSPSTCCGTAASAPMSGPAPRSNGDARGSRQRPGSGRPRRSCAAR